MGNQRPNSGCKLSLCMIVRNGERALSQALGSARAFMDEIVVVDTGSTDKSRQIANSFGAQVIDFPWCDNFSAARNCSLENATGDWIFWMDADDMLPAESGELLRREIDTCRHQKSAFWVTVEEHNIDRNGRPRITGHAHVKLFPRHSQIRFRYRVHEQVAPSIRDLGIPIRQTAAVVRHANVDRSTEGEQTRNQRNLRLVLLDLQERPDDPFVWLTAGTTYLFQPNGLPKAIELLTRSVGRLNQGSQNQLNAYLYLGQALGSSGNRQQEEQVYRQALDLFQNDTMLLTRMGNICENTGRIDEAARYYEAVLDRGCIRLSSVHVRGVNEHLILRLGQIYAIMGRRDRSERLWREFLNENPQSATVREALNNSYSKSISITVEPGG